MIQWFDSHAHLDLGPNARDVEGVLGRARAAGVRYITTIGVARDAPGTVRALALAEQHRDVFATVGVHPHDARHLTPALLDRIRDVSASPKIVAIGETGLDYHYLRSPREAQQSAFRQQLRLAREMDKPVVLHLREAHADALQILSEEGVGEAGGIVHCFSEGPQAMAELLAFGLFISFSGIVTFPAATQVRAAAAAVPADRLLVETDAPYLAPVPHRGRQNEPALVVHTGAEVAALRGVGVRDLALLTTENALRIFQRDRGIRSFQQY